MKQTKKILLFVILLLSINVCGCSIDDLKKLGSIASEEGNAIGDWQIVEIVDGERTITPDKLEDYTEPGSIASKISIHDDNTATITNGAGKVIREPCEWEWTDDDEELTFWPITQYDSEGTMLSVEGYDDAFIFLFDDYSHWILEKNQLQCHIYATDLTDESLTITYERV